MDESSKTESTLLRSQQSQDNPQEKEDASALSSFSSEKSTETAMPSQEGQTETQALRPAEMEEQEGAGKKKGLKLERKWVYLGFAVFLVVMLADFSGEKDEQKALSLPPEEANLAGASSKKTPKVSPPTVALKAEVKGLQQEGGIPPLTSPKAIHPTPPSDSASPGAHGIPPETPATPLAQDVSDDLSLSQKTLDTPQEGLTRPLLPPPAILDATPDISRKSVERESTSDSPFPTPISDTSPSVETPDISRKSVERESTADSPLPTPISDTSPSVETPDISRKSVERESTSDSLLPTPLSPTPLPAGSLEISRKAASLEATSDSPSLFSDRTSDIAGEVNSSQNNLGESLEGVVPPLEEDKKKGTSFVQQLIKKAEEEKGLLYIKPPDYERLGRGLVYNCLGKHWACVDKMAYFQCHKNFFWAVQNKKMPECVPQNVYASSKDCHIVQKYNVDISKETSFCSLPSVILEEKEN